MNDNPQIDQFDVYELIAEDEGEISSTDWKMIGDGLNRPEFDFERWQELVESGDMVPTLDHFIQETIRILKDNWPAVVKIAKHLHEKHSCEDWDLIELGLFDAQQGNP